jgi:hypothetical protein
MEYMLCNKLEDSTSGCYFSVVLKKKKKVLRIALNGEKFYHKLLQKICPCTLGRYAKNILFVSMGYEQ